MYTKCEIRLRSFVAIYHRTVWFSDVFYPYIFENCVVGQNCVAVFPSPQFFVTIISEINFTFFLKWANSVRIESNRIIIFDSKFKFLIICVFREFSY